MFPSIEAQGKSGLTTADIMEPGDSGVLAEAPRGGGDYGYSCGWDCKDSLGSEALARLGGGGLGTGHGRGGSAGMGPVLVSYLCVGEVRAAAWEISAGSAGLVEASGTSGNRVPWPWEEGLTRCREEEVWSPRVFAIIVARMD